MFVVYYKWAGLSVSWGQTDRDLSLCPQEAASLGKYMEKWRKMKKNTLYKLGVEAGR